MLNEIEEFRAYTEFPVYQAKNKSDTGYMGRFTFPMLLDFKGFQRILTILARGFLFADGSDAYDRIEYARRALLAWCSVNTDRKKAQKKAPDRGDPGQQTNYAVFHEEFPTLVDEAGDGWLIRHVENLTRFAMNNPDRVRIDAFRSAGLLKKGFRAQWEKKVKHIQVRPFSDNTKGKWGLRIDDVLADALVLGPLQNRDFELPEPLTRRLTELTPKGVPPEAVILLYKYYVVHKSSRPDASVPDWMMWQPAVFQPEDAEHPYVVLPQQNFNAFFGSTAFSQKWVSALDGSFLQKKTFDGVCKYRIVTELL